MTTSKRLLCVLLVMIAWVGRAAAESVVLAEKGKSDYRIVVAQDASPSTRHAAEELQSFLEQMSGARLAIVSDREPATPHEIILGDSRRLTELKLDIDWKSLGAEGYVLRTAGPRLVIVGGRQRGNLYGVYGLLEDHLGCRWFAPGVSRIPKVERLAVGPLDQRCVPALEYREPYTADCFDGDWCARNRANSSSSRLEEKHGGKVRFANGYFVHTFDRLVPPAKYFDKHPEYFSLVKGKRLKDRSQLCTTNEEVIRLASEAIREVIRQQPQATVFSVSQNDWANYCECEKCQALAKAEGSQMAPVLALVNRVAESVEKEFPDKIIETLAYQWMRKAPDRMRPRPNVVVRLCSIECCFSHPLTTCDSPANRAFREDAAAWAKIGNRLWVWDYVTDFRAYLLPFPNQRVRRENIRFFIRHNVKGIFEQDTYDTVESELAALGGYLTAKFLWNPDYDEQKAIDEFLDGYYGPAAPSIRAYLDLLDQRVRKENIHVNIWAGPESPHLTDALLTQADALWQEAERQAAAEAAVLARVKNGRMSVDYAIMERARLQMAGTLPKSAELQKLAAARFAPFIAVLRTSGLTRLHEGWTLKIDEYQAGLARDLKLKQGQ